MAGEHQLDYGLPGLDDAIGAGVDYHSGRYGRDAGCQQGTGGFIFYQADATGASGWQTGVMAERGNIDTRLPGQFQDGHSRVTTYFPSIEGDSYRLQVKNPSAFAGPVSGQ